MAEPTFQQKKDWARGKNLEPASGKPSWVQSLWASTPGRLAQGSLISDAMGLAQMAVRIEEPVISLTMGQRDPYQDAAVNAVDGWVSDVERNYRDARIAAGQDVSGVDWVRLGGAIADPLNYLAPPAKAPSLLGRVTQNTLTKTAQSVLTDPVNTENESYGAGKVKSAAASAGLSALGTAAKHAVVTPRNMQWLERQVAGLPGIGPAVQAAQVRAFRETWPGMSQYMRPGAVAPDLRPIPPADAGRNGPGLLSIALRSEPVQSLLSSAIKRNTAFSTQNRR